MASKLKEIIKKYLPHPSKIKNQRAFRIFGNFIHDPYLFHLNRHSVSMGFSAGLFAAILPVPFQMLLAAALSIILRGNLVLAVALTWITNPLTTPAVAYFCYRVGTFLLQSPPKQFKFELSPEWILSQLSSIGTPFVIGSIFVALIAAILSNIIIKLIWRYSVIVAWKTRFQRYRARKKHKNQKKVKNK